MRKLAVICVTLWLVTVQMALAEEFTALARLDPQASTVGDADDGIAISLSISQAVPYRVFLLSDPPRLVLDFSEVEFGPSPADTLDRSVRVKTFSWGPIRPGWSRIVAELDGPYRVNSVDQRVAANGAAEIRVDLVPTDADAFATATAKGVPKTARWALPVPAKVDAPKRRQTGAEPLVVVLDPGHGGIDPGAEAGKVNEANVMLGFARELAEMLRRAGIKAVLTRQEDEFVPLESRISVARAVGADVFLSLHADALAEGEATGATVYLLSDAASDAAAARLAERHDRADLLAGVDLSGQDDLVASVMMDMARTETQPRADRLARDIVAAINTAGGKMHRHPIQRASFSVLKSPDIPSVLLEVGFLSSDSDRERLADPVWRIGMQEAILAALRAWAVADAAEAKLVRQ